MRNLKKLASVVLAAVMTLALAVPAFAAQAPGITIENAQEDITYNVYEIFKATGGGDNYSYEATEAWKNFFAGEGAGAAYLTKVSEANETTNKKFPVNIGTESYYLNLVDTGDGANIVDFANKAQAYAMTLTEATASMKATQNGELKFEGLELGYYLVNSYELSQQNSYSSGSLCALTVNNPTETVKVKVEKPTIDKTAENGASAVVKGVGDVVSFTITGKVPNTSDYKAETYKYIVSDKMSAGLTYNADSLKVFLVNKAGVEAEITDDCTNAGVAGKDFSINIPVQTYQDRIGDTIKITYTATVNVNAVENTNPETNEATLTYSNDPASDGTGDTGTTTTTEVKVTVYDVQINVDKYALNATDNTDTSTKLAGAKFALKNANGKYYKYTAAVEANPTEGIEAQEAKLEWVDNLSDNPTIATTKDDGSLDTVFKGLSPNVKYYLEETEAPTGYNKMAADKEIIVTPETGHDNSDNTKNWVKVSETTENNITTVTYLSTTSLNYVAEVMNSTGAELPETGGMGTTLFYAVGGLLVVSAGVLLVVKKRMGAE